MIVTENEEEPPTQDFKIPRFLKITYLVVGLVGIMGYFVFWNGSLGWFDRGYWRQLQEAAQTTFPIEKQNSKGDEPKVNVEESY